MNRKTLDETWKPVRGRVIAGILCEVSADGRRLRFKKGRRVEIVCITGEIITTPELLTTRKQDIQ